MNQGRPVEIRSKQNQFYHETQRLQLCALHSINNLFQEKRFSKSDLDEIVDTFDKSWCWNEYSSLYTGNYDLRIILEAFKKEGYSLRAIDSTESFETFPFNQSFGLLLNKALDQSFLERVPFLNRFSKPARHWFAIKCLNDGNFYDLDSKLKKPQLIGDRQQLIDYLTKFDRTQTYFYIVYDTQNALLFEM